MIESAFYYDRTPPPPKYVSHFTSLMREKLRLLKGLIEAGHDPYRTIVHQAGGGEISFDRWDLTLYAAYYQVPVSVDLGSLRGQDGPRRRRQKAEAS